MESVIAPSRGIRTSTQPRLSAEGRAVLHAALERVITAHNATSAAGVQHALRRICLDARRSEWRPEQLLIAFKSALHTLPSVRRLTRGPDRDELVARLVRLCIQEYFGATQPSQERSRPLRAYRELFRS